MHLEPLIEREWRSLRRRRLWSEPARLTALAFGGLSLVAIVTLALFGAVPDADDVLPFTLRFLFGTLVFSAGGVVGIIASEVQAGTLHLLLLTGLRLRDLVAGQFVCGLGVSLWAALGLMPWVWIGWLNSGRPGIDLVWIAAIWVMVGVALNALLLTFASFGRIFGPGVLAGVAVLLAIGGGHFVVLGLSAGPRLMPTPASDVAKLLLRVVIPLTVVALLIAGWRLHRLARFGAGQIVRRSAWRGGGNRRSSHRARRLLESNPIEWLGAAPCPWWVWLVVGTGLTAPWMMGSRGEEDWFAAGCWTRGTLLVVLAFQAFAQLRFDLYEGTWEALLRTPITVRQYVAGHLLAWWRQQRWPLAVVALMPAVAVSIGDGWNGMDGFRHALWLALAGLLLTAADAALVSVWFLGAAVKFSSAKFLMASLLASGIVLLMQIFHAWVGATSIWPWVWAVMAGVVYAESRKVVVREIQEQLDVAAGVPGSPTLLEVLGWR